MATGMAGSRRFRAATLALALMLPAACDDAPEEPTATLYACFHSPECYDALAEAVPREDVALAYLPEDGAETHLALRLLQLRAADPEAERAVLRRLVAWHAETGGLGIGPAFSFASVEETGVPAADPAPVLEDTLAAQRRAFEAAGGEIGPLLVAHD